MISGSTEPGDTKHPFLQEAPHLYIEAPVQTPNWLQEFGAKGLGFGGLGSAVGGQVAPAQPSRSMRLEGAP